MTTSQPFDDDPAPVPSAEAIASRADFERALLAVLDTAAGDAAAAPLWWCDPDFSTWPLGQPAVIEALARWARSHRRLTLLAADYRPLAQAAPRWHAWRRQWSHVVQCLRVHEEAAAGLPSLVLAPRRVAVRLHDREHHRGRVHRTPLELNRYAEWLDALSQRAEDGLPATTLGL